jgi:hypothetical protein
MRSWMALSFLAVAAGCGAGGSGSGSGSSGSDGVYGARGMSGQMSIRLVDAPADDVSEIVVTVTRVTAHVVGGGGWVDLATTPATVDLLKLQGGTFALLGVTAIPAGRVTQLRLYTDEAGPNYVTTPDGVQHALKVPSGPQSGIKIKGGFDLAACAGGSLTLDFDGKKSIFTHPLGAGAGDEWILRPVVRLRAVATSGSCDGGGGDVPGGDDGDSHDPPPPPPPPPSGGGDDGGVPIITTPPADPCQSVTCSDADFCLDGSCVPAIS